jgi:hypothetical protein
MREDVNCRVHGVVEVSAAIARQSLERDKPNVGAVGQMHHRLGADEELNAAQVRGKMTIEQARVDPPPFPGPGRPGPRDDVDHLQVEAGWQAREDCPWGSALWRRP